MAVKIRLARHGAKRNPHYFIVAIDGAKKREGAFLQKLGFYRPRDPRPEERVRIDLEGVKAWTDKGAQLSETVSQLVKRAQA